MNLPSYFFYKILFGLSICFKESYNFSLLLFTEKGFFYVFFLFPVDLLVGLFLL